MKIETKPLREALDLLRPIVKGRTLPILNCVLLEAKNGQLTITASDIDQFQSERVDCDSDLDALCVNASHLSSCLGAGEYVGLKQGGTFLEIKSDGRVYKLPIHNANEFPAFPESKNHKLQGISCEDLAEGIQSVAFCAHTNPDRYALMSVHVLSKPKMLLCEACDGGNGAMWERPLICPAFEMLIPSDFASRTADALLCKGSKLKLSDNSAMITHDTGYYYCKQSEAKYPDTSNIRGHKTAPLGELEVKSAVDALESCTRLIDTSKTASGLMTFSKSGLDIYFSSLHGSCSINLPGKFEIHEASVNIQSMLKCFRAIKADKCSILRNDTKDSGEFIALRSGDLGIISMCLRGK